MRKMNLINCPVYNKEHLEVTGQLGGGGGGGGWTVKINNAAHNLKFTDVTFVHAHIDSCWPRCFPVP